jgi:hypothetical protein
LGIVHEYNNKISNKRVGTKRLRTFKRDNNDYWEFGLVEQWKNKRRKSDD